jgi:glycopeptide antibiotics resistance protein
VKILKKRLISNIVKISTRLLFILYLLILVNVIILKDGTVFSMGTLRSEIPLLQRIKGVNSTPLKTVIPYLRGEPSVNIAIRNLAGNILAFSPLGFLLPLLFQKLNKMTLIFLVSLGVSLLIEVIQVILYWGSGDIDDLILNVFGAILGFRVYYLFKNLYKRRIEVIS